MEKFSKDHKADMEKVVSTQQEEAERQEDLGRQQESKWLQRNRIEDALTLTVRS